MASHVRLAVLLFACSMLPSVLPRANDAALRDGRSGILLSCAQLRGTWTPQTRALAAAGWNWQTGQTSSGSHKAALAKQRGVHVGGMRGGAPAGEVVVSAVTKKRIQQDLMKL